MFVNYSLTLASFPKRPRVRLFRTQWNASLSHLPAMSPAMQFNNLSVYWLKVSFPTSWVSYRLSDAVND